MLAFISFSATASADSIQSSAVSASEKARCKRLKTVGTALSVLLVLLCTGSLRPQLANLEMTTQERLQTERWWPTMASAPLKAYAGSSSCTQCHTEGANSSEMQRAAEPGAGTQLLAGRTASLHLDAYSYQWAMTSQGLQYSVSSAAQRLSKMPAWVFGAGDLARTLLYQQDGRWFQSEVSFYTRPAALDVTTGLGRSSGTGLPAALGQSLSPEEARSCFSCHTVHATTSAGLEPLHAEPGLGCEACHGPARLHVDSTAAASGEAKAKQVGIFDPSGLSPADSIDFCGACHRTSADAKLSVTAAFSTSVIRFQPYRLEESKCWRATEDERLTCVACHDPHRPLERDSVQYDRHCVSCHTVAGGAPKAAHAARVCPKAANNCVSCHMPKVAIASMHGEFTDHFIRIARPGEALPR